jgi:hypothetical protein
MLHGGGHDKLNEAVLKLREFADSEGMRLRGYLHGIYLTERDAALQGQHLMIVRMPVRSAYPE